MAVDLKMKLMQFMTDSAKSLGLDPPQQGSQNNVANAFSNFNMMSPEQVAKQALNGLISGFDPTRMQAQNSAFAVINKILGLGLTGQPEESKSQRMSLEREGGAGKSDDEEEKAADEKLKQAKKQMDALDEDDKRQLQDLQKSMKAFEDQPIPGDSKGTTTKEALEQREIKERAAGSSELEKQRDQQGSDMKVAHGGDTQLHTGVQRGDAQAVQGTGAASDAASSGHASPGMSPSPGGGAKMGG